MYPRMKSDFSKSKRSFTRKSLGDLQQGKKVDMLSRVRMLT